RPEAEPHLFARFEPVLYRAILRVRRRMEDGDIGEQNQLALRRLTVWGCGQQRDTDAGQRQSAEKMFSVHTWSKVIDRRPVCPEDYASSGCQLRPGRMKTRSAHRRKNAAV